MRLSKDQPKIPRTLFCFFAILITGCASGSKSLEGKQGPVTIVLKSQVGQENLTRYYSNSRIKSYDEKQLVRDRDEAVEFRVSERVTKIENGNPTVVATTTFKDGTVDLHDLAFPEKGEEIEYVFTPLGEVLKAGVYPADSVFFVPPFPIPKGPVSVGDTWTMDHGWVGLKNGIPLSVHLVGILKGLRKCGKSECADVEISGNVEVIGIAPQKAQFTSTLWGRMLIALDRGTVVWSEVRSREKMIVKNERTDVLSCMTAELEQPKQWHLKGIAQACTPSEEPIGKIP